MTTPQARVRQAAIEQQAAASRADRNRQAQVAASIAAGAAALFPTRAAQLPPAPPRCMHEVFGQFNRGGCTCGSAPNVATDDDDAAA